MDRSWFKPMIWLLWLALPTTLLNYWRHWDQLPARIAVHFDANWNPNGYTSREGALMLALIVTVSLLLVFTIAAHIAFAQKPSAAWPMLIVFYVAMGLVWYVNNWIVDRNFPPPAHSELVGPISPAMRNSGRNVFQPRS